MAPRNLIRADTIAATASVSASPTATSSSAAGPGTTNVGAVWDGTIPKGYRVCDSSNNNLTQWACDQHGRSTQMHGNTLMCLVNVSDAMAWADYITIAQVSSNISGQWSSACNISGALALKPKHALALLFILGVISAATAL